MTSLGYAPPMPMAPRTLDPDPGLKPSQFAPTVEDLVSGDNEICGGCGAHFDTEAHAAGCANAEPELSDEDLRRLVASQTQCMLRLSERVERLEAQLDELEKGGTRART
jgi:hypothetical protein